jgi:hypothetical protein
MSLTTAQQVDILWKKVVFGVTDSNDGVKAGYEEAISSPIFVSGSQIWGQTPPTPAQWASSTYVTYYGPTLASALQMTADPTVASQRTWLATTTFNTVSSRVGDWIPPSIDATYLIQIYKNDPTVAGNMLLQSTVGYEWVFDYQAGVLTFLNTVPSGITTLYLVASRYIGPKGLGSAGANVRSDQLITTSVVSSGTATYTNFFTYAPQLSSVTIEINGCRLENSLWNISGTTLSITVGGYGSSSGLPYPIDIGDIISTDYAYVG